MNLSCLNRYCSKLIIRWSFYAKSVKVLLQFSNLSNRRRIAGLTLRNANLPHNSVFLCTRKVFEFSYHMKVLRMPKPPTTLIFGARHGPKTYVVPKCIACTESLTIRSLQLGDSTNFAQGKLHSSTVSPQFSTSNDKMKENMLFINALEEFYNDKNDYARPFLVGKKKSNDCIPKHKTVPSGNLSEKNIRP